jgi:drug/metabolite transporter (DMT)-like permease
VNNLPSNSDSPESGILGAAAEPLPASGDGAPVRPFRGVLLLLGALFFFACMDATTKYLAAHYNVPLIVAIRYIVNCALMIVLLAPSQGMQLMRTQRTGLVMVRALSLVAISLSFGFALQRMPVPETTAIIFLAPLLVVLVAGPILKERIGAIGWAAALGGFAGVLLVVRPGSGLDILGVAFAMMAVAGNVIYQLLSRILGRSERTIALLFYSTLTGSICFGLALPWFWTGEAPTLWQTVLFISLGVNGGIGHYLFTSAFRHAPASTLAPVTYVQLLWALLLGWTVFGHAPDLLTLVGMMVIATSGVVMALRSRRAALQSAARIHRDS